jgi:tetratricopeptide (TPR) repeat protein
MSLWRLFELLFQILTLGRAHKKSMAALRSSVAKQKAIGAVLEAYRRGDYQAGLAATEPLKTVDEASYHFFRGTMLMQLGQNDEAERHLGKCASIQQGEQLKALAYSSFGQVLIEQQRYDEAMKCFETSAQQDPKRGAGDRDFAHLWLRRGNPPEALKWAKTAVEKERAFPSAGEARDLNMREALATLAWAVASTSHDRAQVDALATEATPPPDTPAPASCAEVHLSLAKAYEALGDSRKFAEHLDAAARIDPNGLWGRKAKASAVAQ